VNFLSEPLLNLTNQNARNLLPRHFLGFKWTFLVFKWTVTDSWLILTNQNSLPCHFLGFKWTVNGLHTWQMLHTGVMSSREPLEWQCLLFHIAPRHIQTITAIAVMVIGCLALSAPIFLVVWGVSNIKLFMIAYWYKLSWLACAHRRLQAKCHKVIHLDLEHVSYSKLHVCICKYILKMCRSKVTVPTVVGWLSRTAQSRTQNSKRKINHGKFMWR
jgi:hypothetical protein